jgi:myo-inositol-1(or 4)-monophosphatase
MPPESIQTGTTVLPSLQAVLAICEQASELALAMLSGPLETQRKTDASPVTAIDLAVDKLLSRSLQALFPEAGWLSEETADNPKRFGQRYLWVVDPIDGTRSMLERRPEFCVSVALVESGVGPVLGVIANPMSGERFFAERGRGAYDGTGKRLAVQPTYDPATASLVLSRTDLRHGLWDGLLTQTAVPLGSLAYKMALVAAGLHAGHATPTPRSEWDAAAGHLLLLEAGGLATDAHGEPLRYNQERPVYDGMVVSSSAAFADLLALCQQAGDRWRTAGAL